MLKAIAKLQSKIVQLGECQPPRTGKTIKYPNANDERDDVICSQERKTDGKKIYYKVDRADKVKKSEKISTKRNKTNKELEQKKKKKRKYSISELEELYKKILKWWKRRSPKSQDAIEYLKAGTAFSDSKISILLEVLVRYEKIVMLSHSDYTPVEKRFLINDKNSEKLYAVI